MQGPHVGVREAEVESEEGSCHNPMPDNDMNLRRSVVSGDLDFRDMVEVDDISFDIEQR